MTDRRNFLMGSAFLGAAAVSKAAMGAGPEAPMMDKPNRAPPLYPKTGRP